MVLPKGTLDCKTILELKRQSETNSIGPRRRRSKASGYFLLPSEQGDHAKSVESHAVQVVSGHGRGAGDPAAKKRKKAHGKDCKMLVNVSFLCKQRQEDGQTSLDRWFGGTSRSSWQR